MQDKYIKAGMVLFIGVAIGVMGTPSRSDLIDQAGEYERNKATQQAIIADRDQTIEKYKQLKELDDRGFQYSAEALGYCSNGFDAVGRLDVAGVERATDDINSLVPKILDLSTERQNITKELGY